MSSSDAFLQTIFVYRILPLAFVLLIFRWVFRVDLSFQRINAKLQYLFLGRIHGKLTRQKNILFDQLSLMNSQSTGRGSNIRYDTRLLEIGIGSGRNIDYYPKGTLLTCLDPNPYHESYVMKAVQNSTNKFVRLERFVEGFAEDMSAFRDNSFDVVLCTLTLCTVKDPDAVLREIYRVLKPGGTLYFLEHVAAKKGSVGRWIQEKLDYIQPYICDGCHFSKETWSCLDRSNFTNVSYCEFSVKILILFFLPGIYGTAVK